MTQEANNKSFGTLLNPKTILDIEDITKENILDKFSFEKKIPEFEIYISEYLKTKKSLVVGIYGNYGSGKSVFINLLNDEVKKSTNEKTKFIIFPAWKYKDEKSIWRNFVLFISKNLRKKNEKNSWKKLISHFFKKTQDKEKHEELNNSIYHTTEKFIVKKKDILSSFIGLAIILIVHFVSTEDYASITQYSFPLITTSFLIFQYHSIKRTRQPISKLEEFETEFEKIFIEKNNDYDKIYIVIENIDRCLPHHAIRLLESLNAFIEMPKSEKEKPQCIFLIPCDKTMLEEAIKKECNNLENMNASAYLDKLIQLPYDLPIPSNDHYKEYITSLLNEDHNTEVISNDTNHKYYFNWITDLFEYTNITNPREIKILFREWEMRFVNLNPELKYENSQKENINLNNALILLKLLILKKKYHHVYNVLLDLCLIAENFKETKPNTLIEDIFNQNDGNELCSNLWNDEYNTIYADKINQMKEKLYENLNNNAPNINEKEQEKRTKINNAFSLLKYGTIKPNNFDNFKKFLLTTMTIKKVNISENINVSDDLNK